MLRASGRIYACGNAGLDAKFVGLSSFAFTNVFDFRGMKPVELVLVLQLLGAIVLGEFHQDIKAHERGRGCLGRRGQLELGVNQHDTQCSRAAASQFDVSA